MFKNYLKIAFRNLAKQKYYSIINVFGLALGIAASILIFLWINHETSFDKFHEDYENIYRLISDASMNGQEFEVCAVPSPMAKKLMETCPDVELATRISGYFNIVYNYNDIYYKEEKAIIADTNLFKIFKFKFIEGNPEKPFEGSQSVIITETVAKKLFGKESAMGKMLERDDRDPLIVSAVIKDLPSNSHMRYNMILRIGDNDGNYGNFNRTAYLKLKKDFSESNVKNVIDNIVKEDIITVLTQFFGTTPEQFASSGNYINVDIQPLQSIHLNNVEIAELEPGGNKTYVTFFTIIAIMILVIAGINYMNLSTAYYDTRLKEVGIRKTNGATPLKLTWQFLTETAIISIAAFFVGFTILKIIFPFFKDFLNIDIANILYDSWYFPFLIFLIVILIGLLSGIYPALYISRHKTISIIKNKFSSPYKGFVTSRSMLVIFQFVITIVVIISTILVQKQVRFLLDKELGFAKDNLVIVKGANSLTKEEKELFKNDLKQYASIEDVALSGAYPGSGYNGITGYGIEGQTKGQQYVMKTVAANPDYFKTFKMDMVIGRGFNETDKRAIVLNESAVKQMGLDDPLNVNITTGNGSMPVVGIVKNFHHDPLNISLDPIVILIVEERFLDNVIIRISGNDIVKTMDYIKDRWTEISNHKPLEYFFLDENLRNAYNAEMKAGKIFSAFSILSIFIACMGILGIASFLIQRRIREIGIRKANGARTDEVTIMFLQDFTKWVIIAFIVACPVAWIAMNKWLNNFAYKTELSWWIFIFAGFIALLIALVTVFWLSLNASKQNPVEVLRYE